MSSRLRGSGDLQMFVPPYCNHKSQEENRLWYESIIVQNKNITLETSLKRPKRGSKLLTLCFGIDSNHNNHFHVTMTGSS